MKFKVEVSEFEKSLNIAQAIVAGQKRQSVPVLSHVMISVANNDCVLRSTDLNIEIKSTLKAQIQKEGEITVPAQLLHAIVRSLPEGADIDIALAEDGQLSLTSGKSNFSLHTIPAQDYPNFEIDEFTHQFTIGADILRELIEKTRFAISADETRYYLNGIYFHIPEEAGNRFRAVATDGYRLALSDTPAPKGSEKMEGVIVPRKTVQELSRLIEHSESKVKVSLSKTMVCYECDQMVLTSKVIDGSFPDYMRIIPQNNRNIIKMDNGGFTQSLKRVASIFIDQEAINRPLVKLSLGQNLLSFSSVCSGRGSAQEEMEIDYNLDEIEVGFNPKYLEDITDQLGKNICMKIDSSDVAAVIHDEDQDKNASSSLYVLMPVRV